jgi:5-methyltetrahydropteroyltriglutamate--homocysteine methyltransferase
VRAVVRLQEDLGLKSITDGEFRRQLWHTDFLMQFANVATGRTGMTAKFHTDAGTIEREMTSFRITGRIERRHPIFVSHFAFLKDVTSKTAKITIPSPTVLHFRGGRDAVDKTAYPDIEDFFGDLAAAYRQEIHDLGETGCTYLQIDEVNFAYLCDPALRAQVEAIGENPDELTRRYARLINDAIAERPAGMTVALHLCRGNFEGAWLAEGGYDHVAETLFNAIQVDAYFLEYDTPRAGDFKPLRFVPPDKKVVLGLVSTKTPVLEAKADLKRRIDEAAQSIPLEQLALSPQCGFASGERGNKITLDDELAKLSLIVETAAEVWGD